MSFLGLAAIAIPFIAGIVIALLPRAAGRWISIGASTLSLVATIAIAAVFASQGMQSQTVDLVSIGSCTILGLVFDKVSVLLAPAFVGIGLIVTIYSLSYMSANNREHPDAPRRRFYAFLTVFIGAMPGLVFASTIVGQLVFFEITGACSWALIGYYHTAESNKGAMKALIITHIASVGLYIAAALLFINTGTFELTAIAQLDPTLKTYVMLAILIAAWGKSAQLPFYMWLPSAMAAPTPVSAYLHGASMVKVGVVIFARSLISAGTVPEAVGWVGVIGAIVTLVFSFFMYLPQKDLKRLLAFSTISQLSYIFLGLSLSVFGSQLAFQGSVAHIFNHAFAKTLFFLVAGTLSYTTGTRMLPKIKGLMKKMPLVGIAFGVAALAIAGVPPLNGFFSKFAIFAGGFQAASGNWILTTIVIVGLIETICCFAWFLKVMDGALLGEPSEVVAAAQPVPRSMVVALVVLIVMTFVSSGIAAAWLG